MKVSLPIYQMTRDAAAKAIENATAMYGGSPCVPECSWCCTAPVVVYDPDVDLLLQTIKKLPDVDRMLILDQIHAWYKQMMALGIDFSNDRAYDQLKAQPSGPGLWVRAILESPVWPRNGIPCPLLRVPTTESGEGIHPNGRGVCMVYEGRPMECALAWTIGPKACSSSKDWAPPMDARPAWARIVPRFHLKDQGILAVEIARRLLVKGVN